MKMKSMMLLLVAAGFGLVAMLGVMQVLNNKSDEEPLVRVAVAATDIPAGMPLDETNVAFKELPQSAVPGGAVTKEEDYRGKALVSRAVPGEIIMAAKLGGADAITASHQIPKGKRVATVSVDATKSHSGLIRPTDRVDVVCTYMVANPVTRQKTTHVKTVLEFIEVFAVDKMRAGREGEVDSSVKNVSLIVDPDQFQLLEAAQGLGELNLSLRNREDTERTSVAELSDDIFFKHETSGGSREVPKPEAPEQVAAVTPTGPGLGEFLNSAMSAMAEVGTAPAAAPVETPMWTLTIYNGQNAQAVSVLDEGALPAHLTKAERQRIRAEVMNPSLAVPPSQPSLPARTTQPASAPAEPATLDQPAASAPAPETISTAQASKKPANPPALVPFLPLID